MAPCPICIRFKNKKTFSIVRQKYILSVGFSQTEVKYICVITVEPLNVIALGQNESDNINRMITIAKPTICDRLLLHEQKFHTNTHSRYC